MLKGIIKTYKYKLYKTKRTKYLDTLLGIACEIYNHCIRLHKKYYQLFKKHLNIYRLQHHLVNLKKLETYKHWNKLNAQAISEITTRIEKGYVKFFKKQGNIPCFKKGEKYKSFTLTMNNGCKLSNNNVILTYFKEHHPFKLFKGQEIKTTDKIKTVTFKKDNIGDWYICICLETEAKEYITTGKSVGIDFGLKTFLTLSDETAIQSPLYYLNSLKKLKVKHKQLSSKKKRSNNRERARLELARLYKKIANQRRDFFFKLANELANKYDTVFIEDLNLKGMSKLWGRKVNDLAYNEFIDILSTKTNVVKIDRFYPSSKTCSHCGNIKEDLSLNDRTYKCRHCGLEIDRDYNASLNIHKVGMSTFTGELVRPAVVGKVC